MAGKPFKIEGFKELDAQLGRLSKAASRAALRKAGMATLEPMARLARRYAPRDEDYLYEHTEVSSKSTADYLPEGKYLSNVYMGPSKSAFHGAWKEFGTINNDPHPFMRPAWDADKGNLIERLRPELWDTISGAIDRAKKRGAL